MKYFSFEILFASFSRFKISSKSSDLKIDEISKKNLESKEKDQIISLENLKEINEEIEQTILKEIIQSRWKKKIGFERIKGPNKIYTNFIKKKSQVKTKLSYLEDDQKKNL